MADKKRQYDSIIDAMLDEREPDWKDLGLTDAKKSGDEQLDRTHEYIDKDFMDDIAESASRHTPVLGPKSGSYEDRISEKESANPRIHSVVARREQDYKSKDGDNDSLMDEVTESIEKAYSSSNLAENSAEKKAITEAQAQKYVRDLLNQGMSPAKVAAQLKKLAEIELFNHQSATDYLQRNAGLIGLAYLEPNTYMDKNSPTYERTASGSNGCVSQKQAWDREGVKPQAHSVKQIRACEGCSFFNKDAAGKQCNLYHLPVVSSEKELAPIVNRLTAGVPEKQKHAALVNIANRNDRQVQNPKVAEQTNIVKTADAKVRNQEKRASYQFSDNRETTKKFSSEHVAKMHEKGVSLSRIGGWASGKGFPETDVSFAFRGFVQNLKKNASGKIVLAKEDAQYLNHIGIRNAAFSGETKCASCPAHFNREAREQDQDRGAQRVEGQFAYSSSRIASSKQATEKTVEITPRKVRTLHQAGHSIERIYKGAAGKIGSVQARKVLAGYVEDIKKNPGKIAFSESERAFLVGKLGFKQEQVRLLNPDRRPVTQVVASVPDGQNVLAYPGMDKQAGAKKATDGHAILAEYDLTAAHDMQDIDTSGPKRDDIQMNDTFKVELD